MIAIAAFTMALATPQREALIDRWLHANRAHTSAQLNAAPRAVAKENVAPNLAALAAREMSVPGRYHITGTPSSTQGPWWFRALQWLRDLWEHFWQRFFGRVHVGRAAAADIGDAMLVILGLLVLFVGVRLVLGLQFAREASGATAIPLEDAPSPRALYKAACAAAAGGDYGTATLLLFAATVRMLERRGDVSPALSATVGDLRRELRRNNAQLLTAFDAIAGLFVQRAYAERGVDAAQWENARTTFDRYLSAPQQVLEH